MLIATKQTNDAEIKEIRNKEPAGWFQATDTKCSLPRAAETPNRLPGVGIEREREKEDAHRIGDGGAA
jgi:hypothetical protein